MKKQPTSTENLDGRSTIPHSRIADMSPKKIVDTAQQIVKKATDILEEEIAAGIIAAKELEKKVIDVDKARSGGPDHIMSRFRTDAHEVIDMLMDVVSVASTQLDIISKKVVSIVGVTPEGKSSASVQVPVIKSEETIVAGGEVELTMQLQNDSKENDMEVSLREVDLMQASGDRILARNLKMTPASVILKPGEKREIKIKVKVPKATKAGIYSGLLIDRKIPNLQAMIAVDVTA